MKILGNVAYLKMNELLGPEICIKCSCTWQLPFKSIFVTLLKLQLLTIVTKLLLLDLFSLIRSLSVLYKTLARTIKLP